MCTKNLIALLVALSIGTATAASSDAQLAKAIGAPHRSAEFVARDAQRHPKEELEFIGIKPNQTVVEIDPGGGYWTEILGPYLHDAGTYYTAITPPASSERAAKSAQNWQLKLQSNPAAYGNVKVSYFGRNAYDIAPPGSADLVVTFRSVHGFMAQGYVDEAFAAFYRALKPGGVLAIEEHRALTDQPQDPKAASGYVREDYTIELATKAGFKLIDRSEILANPKDTKDWPKGVWTLPPTLVMGEQNREKYLAIGEADNFLLKFAKPLSETK
jgi:predicted methyltransferase